MCNLVCTLSIGVLVLFQVVMVKYPNKSNFKGKGIYLAYSQVTPSTVVRKSRRVSEVVSRVHDQEQRETNTDMRGAPTTCCPYPCIPCRAQTQGMVLPTVGLGLLHHRP